jgi:hypothetical protein
LRIHMFQSHWITFCTSICNCNTVHVIVCPRLYIKWFVTRKNVSNTKSRHYKQYLMACLRIRNEFLSSWRIFIRLVSFFKNVMNCF